ncbi:Putative Vacuolar protein sorting-associated protein 18 homolog [Rhizopus microsporus]|nr:Putative Vacuolar protein sorting-associated protein 18 homolog [Rhizopus microsporus]
MSLLDDYMESSEAVHGTPTLQFGADAFLLPNGFDGIESVRLETGYVSTGFGQIEEPIFALDYVQFQMPAKLIDMAVSNNILIVALESSRLLRVDLDNPLEVEEIEITRKQSDGKITKIFFDPTGRHLIITTDHGENYYFYEKWRRTKSLPKFKGVTITSIAWNKQATLTDPSTREILIGTKNGLIYETCIEPTDEYFKKEEKYFKQVYSIHESTMPITGLYFEQFPVNNRKYFVMATTSTRIYQFIGFVGPNTSSSSSSSNGLPLSSNSDIIEDRGERAIFENLFAKYDVNPGFQELPGDLPHSELHFFSRYHELQQQGIAEAFAWLTGPGIYHGSLVFGSQNKGDSVIDDVQLLQYPATPSDDEFRKPVVDIPISVALTEFHFILLYKDRVRAICQLNDQIVYEEMIPVAHGERVVGMTVDDIKKTFWIYTTLAMYELTINNEERDVWKLYLEKKKYNSALRYCKDPAQKDKADPDVFYKFSPVLMENEPYETVNVWMRQNNLNPRQLIPALLRYDHKKASEKYAQNQATRYLSHVVTTLNNTDPAIHNFLLTLYATQKTSDETALLAFLKNEGFEMHYDLDYALRLCTQNGRTQSCVHIYSQMGLYEEAVNLALKNNDLELARINADKPDDDEMLRKKLWLNIAKHVIQENKDTKGALEFLKQSNLLKIEDILPFFPDFVLIDDFKKYVKR